ncbi:MAG: hypothetical protein ACPGYX_07645, partial [Oceanobacter sp.]
RALFVLQSDQMGELRYQFYGLALFDGYQSFCVSAKSGVNGVGTGRVRWLKQRPKEPGWANLSFKETS